MTDALKIEKRGFKMPISEMFMLINSGFPQKGHWEEIPLTDEDRAAHARAVAAHEEIESNPWVELSGYEYDIQVLPLKPKRRFVAEETSEEHLARWIEAGRPQHNFFDDVIRARVAMMFSGPITSPFVLNPGGAA